MNDLIEHKLVEQNESRLTEVNSDNKRIVNIWHNFLLNTIAFPSVLVNDSTYVVVTEFVSLDHMYVMHESRVKRLQELEDKWLSYLNSFDPLTKLSENQICFYRGFDETIKDYVNRAKVVAIKDNGVDVFLVDHGQTITDVQKKDLFKIEEKHLKELPFQAIRVSLFGVKPLKTITYDFICEMTRTEDDLYLMAIALKHSFDDNIHTIRLFISQNKCETHFLALSKLLVDSKYAQFVGGEEDNELELFRETEVDDTNAELETDNILYLEEEMKDKFSKDYLRQVFAQHGITEDIFQEREIESKLPNETLASKTRRRIRAITSQNRTPEQMDESTDESDDEYKPFDKKIIPNTGEYYCERDPSAHCFKDSNRFLIIFILKVMPKLCSIIT